MNETLLQDATEVWASSYPRRTSYPLPSKWKQVTAYSAEEVVHNITECGRKSKPGFVSTYSFPRGHTSDDGENIPHVDTLMFDMDYEGEDDGSDLAWAKDMSALLVRTRMVAQALLDSGKAKYWRASLSGHKGIHLYVDFDPIPIEEGDESQFRNGLREYTESLVDTLSKITGLRNLAEYIDVSSGKDLARLTRMPNSLHEKATARFGEDRYCVPITLQELASLKPADYVELTKTPRAIPNSCRRIPSENAHDSIRKLVRTASSDTRRTTGGSAFDPRLVKQYEENEAVDNFTLQHAELHLKQKPCIWEWRKNPAAFKKSQQSHIMEMNVIAALKNLGAPKSVMHEFFAGMEGYNESETEDRINTVISAAVAEGDDGDKYRGLNCETIHEQAPDFCIGKTGDGNCRIWNTEFSDSIPN